MKNLLVAILSLAAISCGQSQKSGSEPSSAEPYEPWTYGAFADKMDDSVTRYAFSLSLDPLPGEADYERMPVRLEIQEPNYVSFHLMRSQFHCYGGHISDSAEINTDRKLCTVRARFDNGKARKFAARELGDSNDWLSIEDRDEFLTELKRSKTVLVELPVYGMNSPALSFDVTGFSDEKLAAAPVAP